MIFRIIVFLLFAFAMSGCATHFVCPANGGPQWIELKSKHFILHTNLETASAKTIIEQLEQMYSALETVIPTKFDESSGVLRVIAFATLDEFSDFVRNKNSAGLFNKALNGDEGGIIIPGDTDFAQRRIITHELAHYLSHTAIPRQPKWFSEGLASYFETAGDLDRDGELIAGKEQLYYWRMLRNEGVASKETLEWQAPQKNEPLFYGRSWLLFRYLSDRKPRQFNDYKARLARLENPRAAWKAAFPEWSLDVPGGTDKLDVELENYLLVADLKTRKMRGRITPDYSIRALSPAEVHAIRIDNRPQWEPDELEAEVLEALAEDPAHVSALTVKAAHEKGNALSLAQIAVRDHPEDPMAWRLLGKALEGGATLQEQEEAYRRALEKAPRRPDCLIDLARVLAKGGNIEQALPYFRKAVQIAPHSLPATFFYANALSSLGFCTEAAEVSDRALEMLQEERVPGEVKAQMLAALKDFKSKCTTRNQGPRWTSLGGSL